MHSTTINLDEIAEFVVNNGDGLYSRLDWEVIKEYAQQHIDYKTILIIRDEKGIVAVCRWNMISNDTAHIIDLVIRKGHPHKGLMRRMTIKGLKMYPNGKYLIFGRFKKYPNREMRKYLISDIIKRRN